MDGMRVTRILRNGKAYYVSIGSVALERLGLKKGDAVVVRVTGRTIEIRKVDLHEVFDQADLAPAPAESEG